MGQSCKTFRMEFAFVQLPGLPSNHDTLDGSFEAVQFSNVALHSGSLTWSVTEMTINEICMLFAITSTLEQARASESSRFKSRG